MNAVLEQGSDDSPTHHFDGDDAEARSRWSEGPELVDQVVERHACVRHAALDDTAPLAIENAHHVRLTPPIHSHEEVVLRLGHDASFRVTSLPWCHVIPVLALESATPHRMSTTTSSLGCSPLQVLWAHGYSRALPARWP